MTPLPGAEMVCLLVGPNRTEFTLHRKLLCTSSAFFCSSLESMAAPGSPASVHSDSDSSSSSMTSSRGPSNRKILWLSEESPEMMDLFVLWLYQRDSFRALLDSMVAAVTAKPTPSTPGKPSTSSAAARVRATANILRRRQALHWNLVKLHLFAAAIRLPVLQDTAMDALQDLYLRCDWDVSAHFVRFLYIDCTREQAFRLRKWAVAMLVWTISNGGGADTCAFDDLFTEVPNLRRDYAQHMDKMTDSRANVCIKNPQLRLPRNRLNNEERHFGYRQCSFHSHRSSVGEGPCPYVAAQPAIVSPGATDAGHGPLNSHPLPQLNGCRPTPSRRAAKHRRMRLASNAGQVWTVQESTEET
ncbi:hypothetical protein BD289DRAFT_479505 [Coniella lustricola]|uniref:BTB domain-containing protein n=1 Tax=Coniella lustricola TaxID=2025994 RepID=A0A2T3AIW8_9PEZI|nr:hypothetical protein BD289DRAFT_479505 [Coniella lustricola]